VSENKKEQRKRERVEDVVMAVCYLSTKRTREESDAASPLPSSPLLFLSRFRSAVGGVGLSLAHDVVEGEIGGVVGLNVENPDEL